jgi:hypothetical protein
MARSADARFSDGVKMDWKDKRKLMATNVLLFVVLFMLVKFNKEYLRPQFGTMPFVGILTGSLPNFLAACLISLAAVNGVQSKRPKRGRLIVYTSSSLVFLVLAVEELRPMWGASTQYDLYDIIASALGSLTAILVYELITRNQKEKD